MATSITLGLLVTAGNSMATNDGALATSSVGDLDISLTIPDLVQVTGLTDIALGDFAGSSLSGEAQVCIYRNGSGAYEIKFEAGDNRGLVDGARGTTAYTLASAGTSDTIPYTVDFEDSTTGEYTDTAIAINDPLGGQTGDGADPNCGGERNAKVRVNVDAADMADADTGNYVGTLYLIVSAE